MSQPKLSELCSQLYRHVKGMADTVKKMADLAKDLEKKGENYFVLAWACDLNGDLARTLAVMEEAIKLEPDNLRYKQAYDQAKKRN